MFSPLTRLLGNTSIALKLALGFGLVLALSLIIASTGWQALNKSVDRSQKLTILSQLAIVGEELRADRILYRTLSNPESLARISSHMEKIDRILTELSPRFTDPLNQRQLQNSRDFAASFKAALNGLDSLIKHRESTRAQLKRSAAETSDALAELTSDLPSQDDE
ncbi:methyl-accepting chemotaxis protein, partial [Pseudomonas petroselini]